MSRSPGRPGPAPKWGGLSAQPVRWPVAHGKHYKARAAELGMSLSEYVARVMARAHDLDFPEEDRNHDAHPELPLGA